MAALAQEVVRSTPSMIPLSPSETAAAKPCVRALPSSITVERRPTTLEQSLQPDDHTWIDVGKLIQNRVPDVDGNTLPSDLASGSYEFQDLTDQGVGGLFEGKVIYDKQNGHVAYGCAICCGYQTGPWLEFDPLTITLADSALNTVYAVDACSFNDVDVGSPFQGNWSTGNTSVATVDYYGSHTGTGAGSTSSSTHGNIAIRGARWCPLTPQLPTGTVTVQIPDHLSVVSDSNVAYNCPIGTSRQRNVKYNVLDVSQNIITRPISILETVDPSTQSSCNGGTVYTTYACHPLTTGNFTDTLDPGCPATTQLAQGCGYVFPSQKWEWCPPVGAPVSIGNIGQDLVYNLSISLGGNSTSFLPGTTFPH